MDPERVGVRLGGAGHRASAAAIAPSLNLHDCAALGEYELGLTPPLPSNDEAVVSSIVAATAFDETSVVHRLPLLLRLLDQSRPLASIPRLQLLGGNNNNDDVDNGPPPAEHNTTEVDCILQGTVDRLEDRIANCAAAEGVEVVTCRLAPMAGRRFRLHGHTPDDDNDDDIGGNDNEANTIPRHKKKKRRNEKGSEDSPAVVGPSNDWSGDDVEDEEVEDEEGGDNTDEAERSSVANRKKKRPPVRRRTTTTAAAVAEGDSQEATVARTLSELVRLVDQWRHDQAAAAAVMASTPQFQRHRRSLPHDGPPDNAGRGGTGNEFSRRHSAYLGISLEDSILAEERSGTSGSATAPVTACDLPATVASLMFHLPMVRHRDVAAALCRADLPQTSALIARLGANAPASVPALIRGCLDALRHITTEEADDPDGQGDPTPPSSSSSTHHHASSVGPVRASLHALANLSPREASRVTDAIRTVPELADLRLELSVAAASLLLEGPETSSTESVCVLILEHLSNKDHDCGYGEGSADKGLHLGESLHNRPDLFRKTLNALSTNLRRFRETIPERGRQHPPGGRLSLVAAALAQTLRVVPLERLLLDSNGPDSFAACLRELLAWAAHLAAVEQDRDGEDGALPPPAVSVFDRPREVLLDALGVALVAACRTDNDRAADWRAECLEGLAHLLRTGRGSSLRAQALRVRFLLRVGRNDGSGLVYRDNNWEPTRTLPEPSHHERAGLEASEVIAAHFQEEVEALCSELNSDTFVFDPTTGLELLRNTIVPIKKRVERVKALLQYVLDTPSIAPMMVRHPNVPSFIEEATAMLRFHDEAPFVPFILPVQMELLGKSAELRPRVGTLPENDARFLLCLLYCFAVREMEGLQSPFVVDFRLLPLLQVRCLCETSLHCRLDPTFSSLIAGHIDRCCPEVRARSNARIAGADRCFSLARHPRTSLFDLLRKSSEDVQFDPEGLAAERAFLVAKRVLPEAVVAITAVSALLSEPHAPPRVFTFPGLYRDPIVYVVGRRQTSKSDDVYSAF